MPRFVILTHEPHPESSCQRHWDLMLEESESLRTWALAKLPVDGDAVAATQLPAHRTAYLTYEGPISRNRGSVKQWDTGWYQLVVQRVEFLELQVTGQRLTGRFRLTRDPSMPDHWTLRFDKKA